MKFVLSTQELNNLIGKIQNVVNSQKPAKAVLANFLVQAYNNKLIISGTDLSLSIRCSTDLEILEEGSTTLPAKMLTQLTRELTAPTAQFSTNNHITTIVSGTSKFKIPGMNTDDYPTFPVLENTNTFTISQEDLKDLIFRTSFALAKDDTRYTLTGSLMEIENNTVIFVGSDGKRLARAFKKIDLDLSITGRYVIPNKTIEEISKNLVDEGEAKIHLMQDKIAIEINNTLIISKLLTGDYPDFSRIIPTKANLAIHLHKEELISLLRQISLFRKDGNHSVRFSFSDGELKLSANTAEGGEGNVTMPIDYHGALLDVAYHPGYVLDALRHCKNETVTLGLIDPYNPGVIVDGTELGDSLNMTPLFVIMPMRLAE